MFIGIIHSLIVSPRFLPLSATHPQALEQERKLFMANANREADAMMTDKDKKKAAKEKDKKDKKDKDKHT